MASVSVKSVEIATAATASGRVRSCLLRGLCILVLMCIASPVTANSETGDTLAVVNGDAITTRDVDKMIMAAHRSLNMKEEQSDIVGRLLNKRINDLLIIQDAVMAGMDEEPEMKALIDDQRRKYAIEAFVRDNLALSESPAPGSVRAFFEKYYWQIQVRRISVRTREEAAKLRSDILAGGDMDALARNVSLDTKKLNGGLYNLLYWADLENRIRDQVHGLGVGEMSGIFPYNDAFSFVRVEQRRPVDETAFPRVERRINEIVLRQQNQEAWEAFVAKLGEKMKIGESMDGIVRILRDSSIVVTGGFLKEDPEPVITIKDGPFVSGTQLRKAVSSEFMENGTSPFAMNFAAARRKETNGIILSHAARQNGDFESPAVEARLVDDREQALIESYLKDTVASKITFKRAELDEFYQQNIEKFRGPEEVKLDILIIKEKEEAEEAARRLADGADFAFIFQEYNPGQDAVLGESRYISVDQLSQPFRDQLAHMKAGQSSQAVEMPMGWMIFRLAGNRPGTVAEMGAVESEIRRVIYQRKFNSYLDEHLKLLKDQSEIRQWPDRVEAYILAGDKG